MKLIVGLGNIGKEYDRTRHNIGFMAVDKCVEKYNVDMNRHKFSGNYGEINIGGEKVIFLKPGKYMNLSGEVIRDFVKFYKISVEDILIISDDMDLSLGCFKLKYKGSSGGHNGLKNIELHLGTQEYKRLKIGISHNRSIDTKDFVLSKFSNDEMELVNPIIDLIPNIVEDFINIPFDNVMNKYNRKWYKVSFFVVEEGLYEYI